MRDRQHNPPADATVSVDLDIRWRGVNERDEPGTLDGGEQFAYVTAAVNCRFASGQPETRAGSVLPVPWNPEEIIGGLYAGKHIGAGVHVDGDGKEWILLCRHHSGVNPAYVFWHLRDGEYPRRTLPEEWEPDGYAAAFTRDELVLPMQAGPEMILWRHAAEPLHWSGDYDDTWQPSTTADVPGDTAAFMQPIPAADFGTYAGGRVVFPVGNGEIGWSDIYAPRRWDAALSRYQIGGEIGGTVTGLAEWRKSALIVFKETAVWAVNNWTGDLSETVLEQVTDQAGCIAHRTITAVGGDLIWLGRGGVYRLTEVLENTRTLSPVPVSWKIPRTMSRVNWSAAVGMACSVLADGLWFLALPVDGSLTNNLLLCFDTRTNEWQGEDALEAWSSPDIHALVRANLFGVQTPAAVTSDNVIGMGHGWHDGPGTGDIRTRIEGRGYALREAGLKRMRRLIVDTEEHGTSGLTLSATLDGQRTVQTLQTAQTRRPEKYIAFGRADRDMENPDDDAQEPNREDYAWPLTTDGTRIGTGIELDIFQTHRLKGDVTGVRRWVKPIVQSTGGRLRLTALKAEGIALAE